MVIKVNRSKLQEGLKKVQAGANAKCAIPIYGNVKIEAGNGKLLLTTTDGDITLYSSIEGECDEAGAITLPIRMLLNWVAKLPEENVTIDIKGDKIGVRSGKSKADFPGISADNFPNLPVGDIADKIVIKASVFVDMLRKTAYAQSADDTRRTLKSVLLEVSGDTLRCVATDGRRLAVAEQKVDGLNLDLQMILPAKSVAVLQGMLSSDGDVHIMRTGSQVHFEFSNGEGGMYTRLVDGVYPNYNQVIPKSNEMAVATIDRSLLISTIDRISVISSFPASSVQLTFDGGVLYVEAKGCEQFNAKDELPVKYAGDKVEMNLNPRYVLDPLRASVSDDVTFSFSNGSNPIVIKSETEKFLCVLMPLRIH